MGALGPAPGAGRTGRAPRKRRRKAVLEARAGADQAAQAAERTAAALSASVALLARHDAARRQAGARLAEFDPDALRSERRGFEARREQLAALDRSWQALASNRLRREELDAQALQQETLRSDAAQALEATRPPASAWTPPRPRPSACCDRPNWPAPTASRACARA
jgi:hypothetical protein